MKIRSGFVSNSSSSSYVILGVKFDSNEEFQKIARGLLGLEEKEKKSLTIEEKLNALCKEWESLNEHDKPKEYYKMKCNELSDEEIINCYKIYFSDEEDEECDDLYEELDCSEWAAECGHYNVIGYEVSCIYSDCGEQIKHLNFDLLQEKADKIEKVSGKKPSIITYMLY